MWMCGYVRPAPLDKLLHQIDQTRSTYPTGPARNGFMNFLLCAMNCHKNSAIYFFSGIAVLIPNPGEQRRFAEGIPTGPSQSRTERFCHP